MCALKPAGGSRSDGELNLKTSQLQEVSWCPLKCGASEMSSFSFCRLEKAAVSTFNSLWARVQQTGQLQQETLEKVLGRDWALVSGFQKSEMKTFFEMPT